ncbi:MAG: hypothetical protein ACYC0X_05945 [Pirellulaceae bacterium]
MINKTRPTKPRRTRNQIKQLRADLLEVIEQYRPMTVRQIYYQAVSRGLIDKTEAAYKGVVCRLLGDMRRDGQMPYDWIADNTRWMRKPKTYDNLAGMLELTQQTYRRAIWGNQKVRVEIWLEKDALAGVLYNVTAKWDVPLMVTRGYPSMSYIHGAAEQIAAEPQFTHLYYFGDHDPSGVDISRFVKQGISELLERWGWDPEGCFSFERVAVTRDQITEFELPTRPTKKSDSRARNFEGESVEVDAIDPDTLRDICRSCIAGHIDQEAYGRLMAVENAERGTLQSIVDQFAGGSTDEV